LVWCYWVSLVVILDSFLLSASHRNRTKKSTEKKGSIDLMVYVKETTTCPKLTLVKTENICHHLDQSRIRLCIKRKQQKFTINSHQTKKILASVKYKSSLTLTHHQCLEQTIFYCSFVHSERLH